jgi:chromosomal replication initiator protein
MPVTTSERAVVAALGQAICQRIGEPRYQLWFPEKTKFTWRGDELIVGVPNHFYQEWLRKQFADIVQAAASDVVGHAVNVKFVIDPELFQASRREEAQLAARATKAPETPAAEEAPGQRGRPVRSRGERRWRQLRDFVVGSCNRVAHAAALSVIEAPGQGPNPLVLHGPVGLGKTHLLEGTYAGLRQHQPDLRTVFVTAEDFTNRFLPALRLGKLASFRKFFRESEVLIVDDLHFLAGKRATQEEFLHTFDALQSAGRQVVVSSDCHPRLDDVFLPELIDRLLGGAVWGLTQPDGETRLEILRSKLAQNAGPLLPDVVLHFLAEQLRGNVRELEGALHSVQHYGRVVGQPVDLRLAREALGDVLRHSVRIVHPKDVDRALTAVLRLDAKALQSKLRGWRHAHPRMLAIYLARKHTAATYTEIGQYFGGRNHSTAVAAEKKVRQWLEQDISLRLGEQPLRARDIVERVERALLQ